MSYPVVAFESCGRIKSWQCVHCATASLEASFSSLIGSFGAVMEPPAEIVTFHQLCVSNVRTPAPPFPGIVMYCTPN